MEELLGDVLAHYALVPPVELFPLPTSGANNLTLGVRTGAGEFVWKAYTGSTTPTRWLEDNGPRLVDLLGQEAGE